MSFWMVWDLLTGGYRTPYQLPDLPFCNGARNMPGCTSFASAPYEGEAMIAENKGILPEQSGIFRWENMRQYVATLRQLKFHEGLFLYSLYG